MLDVRIWLLWASTVLVLASSTRNPLYITLLLLIVSVVGAQATPERRPTLPLRFAAVAVPLAALFNGLTAHVGETAILRLPDTWPLLGGPLTLEGFAFGALNGLMLTAIVGGFAVFNRATPARDLAQLAPRAFHEAGVVLSIALTFIPQTTRSLARIREAQAVRGHRLRGLRDWTPIVAPLLVSGLERALGLAEAMVARGYGALSERSGSARAQGGLALGLFLFLTGWLGWLFLPSWRIAAGAGMAAGAGLVTFVLWRAGQAAPRTRYRAHRWTARDTLALLGCAVTLALPLLARRALYYSPYPRLSLPPFDPLVGLGLLGLLAPAAAKDKSQVANCKLQIANRKSQITNCKSQITDHHPQIHFDHLTYTYPAAPHPALSDVTLEIGAGEFVLVAGPSGAGKSTLLRCLNGLVPHFTGGRVGGRVSVTGHDPLAEGPQSLSRIVGFVFQDPEAQFVVDRVEDEIAFALEQRACPPAEMRARVEEALALLDLTRLRDRPLETLSGGEKQRVAIAAALALRPRILALDEPTSQLDPQSAEEVLDALTRLNRELGLTIVLAEHRLERILPHADRIIYTPGPGRPVLNGPPREILPQMELTPPLVTLGKSLGWSPLPLSVEEARASRRISESASQQVGPFLLPTSYSPSILQVRGVSFAYGDTPALRDVSLTVGEGELVALMGRNGAGKTTLLRSIVGLLRPQQGEIRVGGRSAAGRETADICREVAYLPQEPDALLFAETVAEELAVTLRNHGLLSAPPIAPQELLTRLGLADAAAAYPRDLSVGQRQRVALGAVTVVRPRLLLLDEPTRGMDYAAKRELARLLREWLAEGAGVLLATHDVEWVAEVAGRVVLLDGGAVVADGPTAAVLTSTPALTPQIAQLFPGAGWLTVEDALHGKGRAANPPHPTGGMTFDDPTPLPRLRP